MEKENYKIKVRFVFDGKYSTIDINKTEKDIKDKNLRVYLKYKVKPYVLMNNYAFNKYGIKTNFKNNLCGDCKNMLRCPKVVDTEKRPLEKYPYIKNGVQIILIDNQINDLYNSSVKIYNYLKDNDGFLLDDYPALKENLSNNGREITSFSVFECSKFVDDNDKKSIEDFNLDETSPQKSLNNINKLIKNVE